MTIKVAGQWERGWEAPINEYDRWIHPLREFGLDELHMSPVSGIGKSRIIEYRDVSELQDMYPDLVHVYVDEAGTDDLPEFEHPEDALYIVGRCGYSPYNMHFREGTDLAVKIPSNRNGGGFWGHQAAAIILYDRFLKENS